jgi:enoyl-[acyl-carrier protein] reductase/trans-2-enoyl-CoA reductase (NAD+)
MVDFILEKFPKFQSTCSDEDIANTVAVMGGMKIGQCGLILKVDNLLAPNATISSYSYIGHH